MQSHPFDITETSDYTVKFEAMSKRIRDGADMELISNKIISNLLSGATRDIVGNYVARSRLNKKLKALEKEM